MPLSVGDREGYKSGVVSIPKLSHGNKVNTSCPLPKRIVPYLEMWAAKLGTSEELLTFSQWFISFMEATQHILYFRQECNKPVRKIQSFHVYQMFILPQVFSAS